MALNLPMLITGILIILVIITIIIYVIVSKNKKTTPEVREFDLDRTRDDDGGTASGGGGGGNNGFHNGNALNHRNSTNTHGSAGYRSRLITTNKPRLLDSDSDSPSGYGGTGGIIGSGHNIGNGPYKRHRGTNNHTDINNDLPNNKKPNLYKKPYTEYHHDGGNTADHQYENDELTRLAEESRARLNRLKQQDAMAHLAHPTQGNTLPIII